MVIFPERRNRNRTRTAAAVIAVACVACALSNSTGCKREAETSENQQASSERPLQNIRKKNAAKPAPVPDERVEATVIDIVAKQTGVRSVEIKPGTNLRTELKFDDLDEVETVMQVEDAFGMSISDEAAAKFQTVGDLVDYARAHRKK